MIALDLDNTIICYDQAFRAAASKIGCLPGDGLPVNKATVKETALRMGGNALWTKLQGIAYSEGLYHANPYPGCLQFINTALDREQSLIILSHKTEFPASGRKVNLRRAAIDWLGNHGLCFGDRLPVVFFDSREEKVRALKTHRCRAILDDLPEVFRVPAFPAQTLFVLFDPTNAHLRWIESPRVASWSEACDLLLPYGIRR
jgi:hypothetical protein